MKKKRRQKSTQGKAWIRRTGLLLIMVLLITGTFLACGSGHKKETGTGSGEVSTEATTEEPGTSEDLTTNSETKTEEDAATAETETSTEEETSAVKTSASKAETEEDTSVSEVETEENTSASENGTESTDPADPAEDTDEEIDPEDNYEIDLTDGEAGGGM